MRFLVVVGTEIASFMNNCLNIGSRYEERSFANSNLFEVFAARRRPGENKRVNLVMANANAYLEVPVVGALPSQRYPPG